MTSLQLFKVDSRYMTEQSTGAYGVIYPGTYNYDTSQKDGISKLTDTKTFLDIWEWADWLAKSADSTVLVYLGQETLPNIITEQATLRQYTPLFRFRRCSCLGFRLV